MADAKLVQIAAMVPDDLADAVRSRAQENDRSIAAEIRLALRAWVAENKAAA